MAAEMIQLQWLASLCMAAFIVSWLSGSVMACWHRIWRLRNITMARRQYNKWPGVYGVNIAGGCGCGGSIIGISSFMAGWRLVMTGRIMSGWRRMAGGGVPIGNIVWLLQWRLCGVCGWPA